MRMINEQTHLASLVADLPLPGGKGAYLKAIALRGKPLWVARLAADRYAILYHHRGQYHTAHSWGGDAASGFYAEYPLDFSERAPPRLPVATIGDVESAFLAALDFACDVLAERT